MAQAKGNFFTGAIGPVVFYVMNGKQYGRSIPVRIKKPSARMIERNDLFAQITGPSSMMLRKTKEYLAYRVGFNDYNRLRGWMYISYCANHAKDDWPISVDNNICNINPVVDLRQVFTPNITVTSKGREGIVINFPSFNPLSVLRAPRKATRVTMTLIAACAPPGKRWVEIAEESFKFDYRDVVIPPKDILLTPESRDGDITIVTMAIEYGKSGTKLKADPKWQPAAVIAVGRMKH